MNPVFLPMMEAEENNPNFYHPPNWDQLTDEQKADLLVIANQIKLFCVADFSSHYFKEISSLSKFVEDVLNKDSRLDGNAPVEPRPSLDEVIEEIIRIKLIHAPHALIQRCCQKDL